LPGFLLSWRTREGQPLVLSSVALVSVACVAGVAIACLGTAHLIIGVAAIALVTAVALRPPVGVYLLIVVTPLVAGIDRGSMVPLLRPNELLDVIIGAGLVVGGLLRMRSGAIPQLRIKPVDRTILLVAVTSSIIPLAWMLLRGQTIESDDLLYSVMVWKYYGVYLIARMSVRTDKEIRNCLWLSMVAAAIVSIIAILQSLNVSFVTGFLGKYYVDYGYAASVSEGRGGATLSLPIAVADLLTFNLAIAVGFLARSRSYRRVLVVMSVLFVIGVLSAGEFSGVIGLLLGIVVMAVVTHRARLVALLAPVLVVGALLLRSVVGARLSGFQSASGLPNSWSERWWALTTIFWPQLFSHGNFILGVRPAARVATASRAAGYIWIESGYTWLLWAGGIPLLVAFMYFLWKNVHLNLAVARVARDSTGVAAFAVVVALSVVGVLMIIDPHLTYRGSADLMFVLLGLATAGAERTDVPNSSISSSSLRAQPVAGAP